MRYAPERREAVLKKMLPPHNRPIRELAREEGISEGTLYLWRRQARAEGRLMPDADTGPEGWTSRDKFNAVLESAALSEAELGEYCRKRGLYPEQLKAWRAACEQANDWEAATARAHKEARKVELRTVRELRTELRRKEQALAETAALLVLRKKAQAIWGEGEDA